jgi:hypothetical protein
MLICAALAAAGGAVAWLTIGDDALSAAPESRGGAGDGTAAAGNGHRSDRADEFVLVSEVAATWRRRTIARRAAMPRPGTGA